MVTVLYLCIYTTVETVLKFSFINEAFKHCLSTTFLYLHLEVYTYVNQGWRRGYDTVIWGGPAVFIIPTHTVTVILLLWLPQLSLLSRTVLRQSSWWYEVLEPVHTPSQCLLQGGTDRTKLPLMHKHLSHNKSTTICHQIFGCLGDMNHQQYKKVMMEKQYIDCSAD